MSVLWRSNRRTLRKYSLATTHDRWPIDGLGVSEACRRKTEFRFVHSRADIGAGIGVTAIPEIVGRCAVTVGRQTPTGRNIVQPEYLLSDIAGRGGSFLSSLERNGAPNASGNGGRQGGVCEGSDSRRRLRHAHQRRKRRPTQADGRNRRAPHSLAHHEAVCCGRNQRIHRLLWLQGPYHKGLGAPLSFNERRFQQSNPKKIK